MLLFKGLTIPGTHGQVVMQSAELASMRRYFWGLGGVGEIFGGPTFRQLSCSMWIHNRFTGTKLHEFLDELDGKVGDHGALRCDLRQTQGFIQTFNACTFEGFFREVQPGQNGGVMLQDITGTVETPAGYWFCPGTLVFTQLQV